MWAVGGQLDWFAAWLCDGPLTGGIDLRSSGAPWANLDTRIEPADDWLDRCRRDADESGIPAPYSAGGYDPLHLSGHCFNPLRTPSRGWQLVIRSSAADHGTLMVDRLTGWYRAIGDAADRDWPGRGAAASIDVSCTAVGSLGTFGQSPATGLWASVSERLYLVGN